MADHFQTIVETTGETAVDVGRKQKVTSAVTINGADSY